MIRTPTAALIALASLAAVPQAHAQEWLNCQASAGDPARVVDYGPDGVRPFELVTALRSHTISSTFVVQDSTGRGIGGQTIELVLPEEPEDLQFVQLGPGVTAKRAVVDLPVSCDGYLPQMIGSSQAGTAVATLRVVGRAGTLSVPVRAVATSNWVAVDVAPPFPYIVAIGQVVGGGASVQWSDGQYFGPLAGIPITVVSPASDPTIRFANGSNVIVVESDANGGAGAFGIPTAPGVMDIRSTYPDGSLATIARYVVLAAPSVEVAPQTLEYGSSGRIRGTVRHAPVPCDQASSLVFQLEADVQFLAGGAELSNAFMELNAAECVGQVLSIPVSASLVGLPFGTYQVSAEISGGVLARATSAPAQVVVTPSRTLLSATGRGSVRVGSADPGYSGQTVKCTVRDAVATTPSTAGAGTGGLEVVDLPYGALRIQVDQCLSTDNSGFLPPPPPPSAQAMLLELDEAPVPGTVAWAYGPTVEQAQPHWYELRTSIAGRLVQFEVVDGGLGDQPFVRDETINTLVTLGVPKRAAVPGSLQDLWWAGPVENGWGMSIIQHRDVLFGALFIYDAGGNPRWLVMPGGSWNAERTAYSGNLFSPRGSLDHSKLPSTFVPGAPVGTIRLTPSSRDAISLEYSIGGVSGSKQITRQPFGPPHPVPTLRFDDMWWAGMTQNGWGFALTQQYRNYFGVIYTYDAQGEPVWYVAPSLLEYVEPGVGGAYNHLDGPLYRTRGSPWVGMPYDPNALVATEVGTLSLHFESAEAGQFSARIAGRPDLNEVIVRQPF